MNFFTLQGNGTLTCGGVLQIWEPVREAAGLNQDAMAMWCSVSLHPLLEAYGASQRVYAHMNMSVSQSAIISFTTWWQC